VLAVFGDHAGRLVGKRTDGEFYLDVVHEDGTENCDYLIACDLDNNPINTSDQTWQTVLDVNVTGVARCCRHGIPAMLESGGGSIINVASFVAHMGAATPQIAYTASKGAVLSMTREIACIYARQGIRANALCPGPVLTPLLAKFLSDDAKRQRRLIHVPMGRFGEPIEIANGALFLASDDSSFMTGQSLIVDGGITAAYTTPE
jgi:NAD(P)-dependent dehydrogenase (short-subunit alcohol dehydrogenase family)